ncbi:PREDICTED: spondin-1 isoform X3 [Wasmannia auropunctata]|uniref:spondin-1 isoform X3 n=1 Tax=Wasmannia auropunctata TaxID=64793 RepID=UPI0005EDC381|nr:PREDICTED: spondin-1 isoform X3 [Wasmannia auropunctata]
MCHGCVSLPRWKTHVTRAKGGRDFYVYFVLHERHYGKNILSRGNIRNAIFFGKHLAMCNTRIVCHAALLLLASATYTDSTKCSRIIEGTTGPRSSAEGKYHFFLTLFNRTDVVNNYMPNTRYSVVLQTDSTEQMRRKFTRFLISAEPKNANETADVGVFDLEDDTMTKFADNCANAVVETSNLQKEEISVIWTSPAEGSGCILLRATVLETIDTWYMDDENLKLEPCQDSKAEADDQGPVLAECCACDEAKFEVTFEGLWSRNTHPKDFPSKGWLIRFSDVIGASHTGDYRFWHYNGNASEGLRQVAEFGATRKLESELKDRSEHIRTIIKARGISYPNVTGRTFAVFRVDKKHHLMSLVSMIFPSPDWFVGVSGLELCLPNCTWVEHKQLNLYPYDAGTDNGISYMSNDSRTDPQEPIRRITSTDPNNSSSPFYDPSGLDMKPLAKLYLNRQRLYEKTCDDAGDTLTDAEACRVTSWGKWAPCSVTCGKGSQLRQRDYRDKAASYANKCSTPLSGRKPCFNAENPYCLNNGGHGATWDDKMCDMTPWSPWSECSSTCGEGSKTRYRNFRQKRYRKHCRAVPHGPLLQQTINCGNKPCEGEDTTEEACPADRFLEWSMWSPCSVSCGSGIQVRSRQLLDKDDLDKDDDNLDKEKCKMQIVPCTSQISCNYTRQEAEKICNEPKKEGNCTHNQNINQRAYFDKKSGKCLPFLYIGCGGNRNNFPTVQDCQKVCINFHGELRANLSTIMKNLKVSLSSVLSYHIPVQQQRTSKAKRAQHGEKNFNAQPSSQIIEWDENGKVDCQVSEWSKWSRCENCHGFTTSTREIMIPAQNGGKRCPKIYRKKKCRKVPPCSLQGDGTGRRFHRDKNTSKIDAEITVDCKVTPWSRWSRCSATCGESLRTRVRSVMVKPKGAWAKLCPTLVEFKNCHKVDCPQ